jgi:phosphohistidine phosphatase
MKELIFVRHAKSDWDNPGLKDIERPLGERGIKDAPIMAGKLKSLVKSVDHIVSSPAVRALETAKYFANAFGIEFQKIDIRSDLYEAYFDDILKEVHDLENDYDTVLFFGHNPGYTYLANHFSTDFIENVPTCGIFRIQSSISKWKDFDSSNSKLNLFLKP